MSLAFTVAAFALLALTFDVTWSLLCKRMGGDQSEQQRRYGSLALVSLAIYLAAGFVAALSVPVRQSLLVGSLSGLSVAAVDATLGWWVSSQIGPGRLSRMSSVIVVRRIAFVAGIGSIMGAAGALTTMIAAR